MSPKEKSFGIDLADEVVRGSIVTHDGKIIPPAPRPVPPPAPKQEIPTPAKEQAELAISPWQKATRDVTATTAGMGTALALGKATGPVFMSNMLTFGLAGLVGYRAVWGVAPALHSPLMSVTNAISGEYAEYSFRCFTNADCLRYGRNWRFLHYGRRLRAQHDTRSPRCCFSSTGIYERIGWLRYYQTHVGYVQALVLEQIMLTIFAHTVSRSD